MMIGWLMDFIFSNIWILFILLWVFRSLSKSTKNQPHRQPHRPIAPMPVEIPWEMDVERPVIKQKAQPLKTESPREGAREERKEQPTARRPSPVSVSQEKESDTLPPPVQGMIWSQVFGPPRAKSPHYSRRK